jgi:rhodanese-related sulfurtransferase
MKSRRLSMVLTLPILTALSGCANAHRTQSVTMSPEASSSPAVARPPAKAVDTRSIHGTPRENAMLVSQKEIISTSNQTPRHDITVEQIREHQKNHTAMIVDARSPEQFIQGHLTEAINLPAGQRDANIERMHQEVAPDQLIIIYCASAFCEAGDMVYEYLADAGYTNMRVYKPGWEQLAVARIDRSVH